MKSKACSEEQTGELDDTKRPPDRQERRGDESNLLSRSATLQLIHSQECELGATAPPASGASHLPDSADLNAASTTAIFLIPSVRGTGTSPFSRMAWEQR